MPTLDFVVSFVRALLSLARRDGQIVGRDDPRVEEWRQLWLGAERDLAKSPAPAVRKVTVRRKANAPAASPQTPADARGSSSTGRHRELLHDLLAVEDDSGRRWGDAKWACYALFDLDGEPIWLDSAQETARTRLRRILISQRSDATATGLLDVREVASVEIWPLWEFQLMAGSNSQAQKHLAALKGTLYAKLTSLSKFGELLSPQVRKIESCDVPESIHGYIIDDETRRERAAPFGRIARMGQTVERLSERFDNVGVQNFSYISNLALQSARLNSLAGAIRDT